MKGRALSVKCALAMLRHRPAVKCVRCTRAGCKRASVKGRDLSVKWAWHGGENVGEMGVTHFRHTLLALLPVIVPMTRRRSNIGCLLMLQWYRPTQQTDQHAIPPIVPIIA